MKRKNTRILFAFALTAFCLMFCNIRAQAASLSKKTTLFDQTEKKLSYDMTGDGKRDNIRICATKWSSGFYKKFMIDVNGKKALTLNFKDGPCSLLYLQYISCSRKNNYLLIEAYPDASFVTLRKIYKYSGGRLKEAVDLLGSNTFSVVDIKKVTSSSIKIRIVCTLSEIGVLEWNFTYKPSGNKLKLKNSTAAVKSLGDPFDDGSSAKYFKYFKKNQFITRTGRRYYTSSSLKKKAFSTKSGEILTLKKIKVSGKKMYLCFKKGKKTGWIYVKKEYYSN